MMQKKHQGLDTRDHVSLILPSSFLYLTDILGNGDAY